VTDPLRALATAPTTAPVDVTDPNERQAIIDAEIDQLVHASRFLLVDFAEFLVTNLPDLWTALDQQARPGDTPSATLYDALENELADKTTSTTWRRALIDAWSTAAILYGDASGNLPSALNLAHSALTGNGFHRPLREIRYDRRLGLLELAVGPAAAGELPLRYFICDPRVIRVLESAELTAVLVEDARRVRTLIRLYPGWGSLQEGSSLDST